MILFLCETLYTLFNAIQIKCKCFPDENADVLLTGTSRFESYVEKLESTGVFDEVIISDFSSVRDMAELRHNMGRIIRAPQKYEHALKNPKPYTDYFLPVATSDYEKVIFYQLAMNGPVPRVHFYDEGMLTYYADIMGSLYSDSINHGRFSEDKRFGSNIADIYVYEPELITIPNNSIPIKEIPKIDISDSAHTEMLVSVFGKCRLPDEKFIFLEECFWTEGKNTCEIDILDRISERVGKENIIVKLHPRTVHNVFAMHGYKTFLESNVPWEMFVLNPEFKEKILLTVSSGSAITSKLIFGEDFNAIYIWKIMTLAQRYHIKVKNFRQFFDKTMLLYNQDRRNMFCPSDMSELDIAIKYFEGVL